MSGFDDTDIDIVERLSECANIDEAEGATMEVVRMTREAANVIRELRKRVAEYDWLVKRNKWLNEECDLLRERVAELEGGKVVFAEQTPNCGAEQDARE